MIDVGAVKDAELLEILEDLSDLELELEQEIEIVHQRQEEARRQLEARAASFIEHVVPIMPPDCVPLVIAFESEEISGEERGVH